MKLDTAKSAAPVATVACVLLATVGLAGCAGEISPVDRAEAQVAAKEKAVAKAEEELTAASDTFCQASESYVVALDRYGDVLNDTAPTVGDVREAGADLAEPGEDAFDGAEAAVEAQQALVVASRSSPMPAWHWLRPRPAPLFAPLRRRSRASRRPWRRPRPSTGSSRLSRNSLRRKSAITDQTPLADASEQFNAAAVALELAWLRLVVDAGCLPDEQKQQAVTAVSAYTTALQQDLAAAGYYAGAVDGVYGPVTVAAVEDLQRASGLPVTGAVDKATAEALQAELVAIAGAAAQESVAATAAVQQTLKLVGFWDGPVDGVWTPELTEAVQAFQIELGVEPTGTVDAATISAFEKAIAELQSPDSPSSPSPTPSNE